MLNQFTHKAPHLLAAIAACLQIFLPGVMSVARANGIDVTRYICITPGVEASAEAQAVAAEVAALLGEDNQSNLASVDHCPLCTFAQGAPLPAPALVDVPCHYEVSENWFDRYEPGRIQEAQGPPLGSRGPPSHG